jgi:amidohydrolase
LNEEFEGINVKDINRDKLEQIIIQNEKKMLAFRRELHEYPELSWEEFETTKKIAAVLDKYNIEYRKTEPTGIIGEIKGPKAGKTVLLRADIDAIPVQELNDFEYKSKFENKMHACGHDAHATVLLYALIALNEIKESLSGTVRFVFQPAEEITEGAFEMIKQGATEGVDSVFGMHIWSQVPSGKIACSVGPAFASADVITVKFKGKGGHGAMPHLAVDAAVVASTFVENIQAVVSRETDPLESAVITIGRMDVGTRFNVIAENAVLEGTVRTLDEGVRDKIEASISHYAKAVADIYGAKSEVTYFRGTNVVYNEAESTAFVRNIIAENFGEDSLLDVKPTMGGEDFSHYLTLGIPGCFALLGCGNAEKNTFCSHHNGYFNIDEDVLKNGSLTYASYAYEFLKKE